MNQLQAYEDLAHSLRAVAYDEGYMACHVGRLRNENPYDYDNEQELWFAWRAGYIEASDAESI